VAALGCGNDDTGMDDNKHRDTEVIERYRNTSITIICVVLYLAKYYLNFGLTQVHAYL